MDKESANFQAALHWAVSAAADETICLRFCVALYIYWETRGHYSEGSRLMVEALNRATAPSSWRAKVLASVSLLFRWIGYSDKALALLEEAIALCELLGDEINLASGVHHLGQHYGMQLDYAAAAAQFRRSLEIYRRLGKPSAVARVLGSLAQAQLRQGAYDEAEMSYGEALEIRQQLREEHGISHSLHGLGQCALLRGDLARAEKMLQEALRLRYHWGHRRHLSNTIDSLGKLRIVQGNIPEWVRLMGLARGMWREMGLSEIVTDEHMTAAHTILGDELMAQHLAEGETLSVEQALKIVEAL